EAADKAFHAAIAKAADNRILLRAVQCIGEAMQEEFWVSLKRRRLSRIHSLRYLVDHEMILQAIKAREPGKARRAMIRHLQRVEKDLLGGRKRVSTT
ncbi:MAG TPA: FCD domain-containing protein, partial [Firmicutes bacterium]|nr:FCD domain-containing protein [Bacillota bacterium]